MGLFIALVLLVTCSCLMICLFLLLDLFRNFLHRNLLTFNTLVFLPNFCCCLLFQLNIFSELIYSLLSSVLGCTRHMNLSPLVLKSFLRFLVVCPMRLGPCDFLDSTWNFPKTKILTWGIWFGFPRIFFRLSVAKFEYWASCLCLSMRVALVCIHWKFELIGFASWYFLFVGSFHNLPLPVSILDFM